MTFIRLSAFAIALTVGAFASGASAGELGAAQPVAGQAGSENLVLAWALSPSRLPVESDVIEVQFGKKGKGVKGPGGPGPGFARRRGSRSGRNAAIGIGIGAAFLGAIIASEAARADAQRTCQRWLAQCDAGRNWACRRFDENCQ
jgi:hypothetical protein